MQSIHRVTKAHQLQLVSPFFSCSFLVLWQGPSICLSFRFLWFSICDPLERQSPLDGKFFFLSFLSFLIITRPGILTTNRGSFCILKSQRIFQDEFWVVHIPFASMVWFQFLKEFPVKHLSHSAIWSYTPFVQVCYIRLLLLLLLLASIKAHNF